MAAQPYIPRADAKFLLFAQAFCNGISADPAKYMMTPAQAAQLMAWLNVFQAALLSATDEGSRTKGAISAKVDARSILQNGISSYAAFIKINDGIADEDKINIGVPPRNISHRSRVCPSNAPLLNFAMSMPGNDELYYRSTPTSKAKPYGAARLELWVAWSGPGAPVPSYTEARPIGSFTKSKMIVPQDSEKLAMGLRPTYYARWASYNDNKGQNVSSWSLPASLAIATEAARKQAKANRKDDDASTTDASLKLAA